MSARADGRLVGVDVARGVALLGMTAVHVFPESGADGDVTPAHLLASGRAAALFAVLAGVGLALLSGGARPRVDAGLRTAVLVRAVCVAAVGLVLADLPSGVAVILVHYGLLFAVAVPLLGLRPPALVALAAVGALVVPVVSFAVRPHLPPRLLGNPSVPALVAEPESLVWTLLLTGYYPVLVWTAYLCVGLAVGRLALGERRVQASLLGGGAALAVGASLVSALLLGPLGGRAAVAAAGTGGLLRTVDGSQFGNVPTTTAWWLATDAPHASTPLDLLHTTGTALAVLGAALLVTRVPAVRRLLRPLADSGAMTLSLYAAHVVALGALGREPAAVVWAVHAALLVTSAVLWRRRHRRGPLEQVIALAAGRGEVSARARASPDAAGPG